MIYNFDIYDTDYNKVYEMGYSGTSYEVALEKAVAHVSPWGIMS